jgi:hypothetical protein
VFPAVDIFNACYNWNRSFSINLQHWHGVMIGDNRTESFCKIFKTFSDIFLSDQLFRYFLWFYLFFMILSVFLGFYHVFCHFMSFFGIRTKSSDKYLRVFFISRRFFHELLWWIYLYGEWTKFEFVHFFLASTSNIRIKIWFKIEESKIVSVKINRS